MRLKSKLLRVTNKYYHGSYEYMERGLILTPRDTYEQDWGQNRWYQALEYYRPKNMLSHKEAIFMCDNPNDIDSAGGGTDWVFTLEPLGRVERHDMNWMSTADLALESSDITDEEVSIPCHNYWEGVPSNDPLWEYLTPKARILSVEEY